MRYTVTRFGGWTYDLSPRCSSCHRLHCRPSHCNCKCCSLPPVSCGEAFVCLKIQSHLKERLVIVSFKVCFFRAIQPFWKLKLWTSLLIPTTCIRLVQITSVVEEEVLLLHTTCLVGKHKASLKKKKINQNDKRSQRT